MYSGVAVKPKLVLENPRDDLMYGTTLREALDLHDEAHIRCQSFPGGERHCFLSNRFVPGTLRATIRNANDLMDLLLVTNAFRHIGGEVPSLLYLPYMPGARQDRVTAEGHPFSLEVYAQMINNLGYKRVIIYEPHSDVTTALVKRSKARPFDQAVIKLAERLIEKNGCQDLMYFSPDAGAEKRTFRALQATLQDPLGKHPKSAFDMGLAIKHRDPATGKIAKVEVVTKDLKGRDILVLDDICDGGRTFNLLAEELRKLEVNSMHLFVAHGIFSAEDGVDTLLKNYATVSTTNTVYDGRFGDKVAVYYGL